MHTSKIGKKGKLAALLAAVAVVFGGAFSPLTPDAAADTTTANSWAELKQQVNSASGNRTITLGQDFTWDGTSINIPAGKNITINGDHTIYRDTNATTLNSMFTVKGTLTIGGKVKLSGKAATCTPGSTPAVSGPYGGTTPTVTKHTDKWWAKHSPSEKYGAVANKRVMLGFRVSNRTDVDPVPGIAYIGAENQMRLADQSDVIEETPAGSGRYQLKSGVNPGQYVFLVTDVDSDSYQAAWFNTTDGTGKVIGRSDFNLGDLSPVMVVDKTDGRAHKIENDNGTHNPKFSISGEGDLVNHKYILPNTPQSQAEIDKQDLLVAGARGQLVGAGAGAYGTDGAWLWVEESEDYWTVEGTDQHFTSQAAADQYAQSHTVPQYWTVEGTDQHFDSQAAANQWAQQHATAASCTPTCSKVTKAQFNGSRGNEKGYFVQVNQGGKFTLQGNAELRDLLTESDVTYAAPVVSKGGTVNITGGTITHNSVGYSANNADSNLRANQIWTSNKDGWSESGKLATYKNTESAGALILTEGSKGTISGGSLAGNRGDTGAVVVQGKPDRDRSGAQNTNVQNGNATASSLVISGGQIDNNVGIHHAGGIYIFNGADVEMTGGKITNNFAWNKGGAVWASEESYASFKKNGSPSMLAVGRASFIMNGGEISGNMAVNRGGGIEVMSDRVALLKGKVINNYSRVLGGAVYVEGDASDRLYQLFVAKGCVTNNTAVPATKNNTSAPLYRTLNTATDCDFSNAMNGTAATDISDHKDYNNYAGYGGGIWLCSFGGNTTFAVPNTEVSLWGNKANKKGKDLVVRPLKKAQTNGFSFLDLGTQVFEDEDRNGVVYSNATVKGKTLMGPVHATATSSGSCSADGVEISGNIAPVGGGIAANGNVVFGDKAEIAQAFTTLKLTKVWSNEVQKKNVTFKLYAEVDGQKVALPGYEVTLDGTADAEPGEDGTVWESSAWVAEMGMPLSVTVGNRVVPLFTFDVNNTPDDPSDDLDPSKVTDLVQIAQKVNSGQLTKANAKIGNWKLVVEETIGGVVQTETVDLGSGVLENLEYLGKDTTQLKDMNGRVVGDLTTYKVGMGFSNTIGNDLKPVAEKYVNNKVHDNIVNFDQEFTYDVLAYVPLDATSVTISDTLVEGLEFADANGNATTNGRATVQQIAIKSNNNHQPNGTVAAAAEGTLALNTQTIGISGNTLTVTIDKATPLSRIKGKWVQVTFKARIKDSYRSIEALKDAGWSNTGDNKQGNPVPSAANDGLVSTLNGQLSDGVYVTKGVIGPARLFAKTSDGQYWTTSNKQGTSGWELVTEGHAQYQNAHDRLEGINNSGTVMELTVPPLTANWPVQTDETHEGMLNKATYTVVPVHDGVSSYETNTVTVTPETTQLKVEKKWNVGGSTEWPSDIQNVTFGVFETKNGTTTPVMADAVGNVVAPGTAGAVQKTVQLNSVKTSDTVTGLPKLKGVTYSAKEIAVNGEPVSGANNASASAGVVNLSDTLSYIANTIQTIVDQVDTYLTTNSTPQVEKYVNSKVHANLQTFDETVEYSVMAYVPEGATKAEITDNLTDQLVFLNTAPGKVLSSVVVYKGNSHIGDGSGVGVRQLRNAGLVAQNKRADSPVEVLNGGKTVKLTLGEGFINEVRNNDLKDDADKGFWVKMSFKAKINPAKYAEVEAKLASGDDTELGIGWEKVTDDKTVLQGADVQDDGSHAGLLNKASYKVYVGNEGTSDYETNTVTIKPETVTVTATKKWLDANGDEADWPAGVDSVTVNVLDNEGNPVLDNNGDPVTLTITENSTTHKAEPATSIPLPKLASGSYAVQEVPVGGYIEVGDATGEGTVDKPYVFTNRPVGDQQIEKYINNGVHENLDKGFDTSFKYDIMVFVPLDANTIQIDDQLVDALEFAKAPADGTLSNQQNTAAVAYNPGDPDHHSVSDVVTSIVTKDDNNHKVGNKGGTVKSTDGADVSDKATVTIDGKHLKVTFGSDTAPITDAYNLRGKWIQVTFWAKYTPEMIASATVGNSAVITNNGTVQGGMARHEGTTNDATYRINGGNEYESNTVTVKGKDTEIQATKLWQNSDGVLMEWPSNVDKVEINVLKTKTDDGTVLGSVDTIELNANSAIGKSGKLPVLVGVTYKLDETTSVPGYSTTYENNNVVINKELGKPQIEKYINKNVDAHLVQYDKVITYDILAYVPVDADSIEINDQLVGSLEFAKAPAINPETNEPILGPAVAYKPGEDNVSDVVSSIVTKTTNNHTVGTGGTVSSTDGVDVSGKADVTIDGNHLKVAFGSAETPITNADNLRGRWIQVTFYAKYTQAAINAANTTPVPDNANVTDNGSVLGGAAQHDGTKNDASYTINATNTYNSNVVTHDAERERVRPEKQWTNQDGSTAEWPEGVENVQVQVINSKTGKLATTVELTPAANPKYSEWLPKLTDVTYQIKEMPIRGYTSTVEGNVVTNRDAGTPQIEKYINNGVHENLNNFDTSFKYDIMVYVPEDADSFEINDTLVAALEFAKAPADGKLSNQQNSAAVAYNPAEDSVNDVVTSIVAKNSNNHKVARTGGTVAQAGGTNVHSKANIEIDGNHLKVTFGSDVAPITDADGLRGKWIQVTFWAKYTQEMINTATSGNSQVIIGNGTVLDGMARHEGTTNDATYKIGVRNEWSSDYKSNIVTVRGKSTQLAVKKTWSVNGSSAWPEGIASVTFGVFANGAPVMVDANGTIVSPDGEGAYPAGATQMTVVLDENKTNDTVTGLPVLVGVTYTAKEIAITDTDGNTGQVSGEVTDTTGTTTTGVVNLGDLISFIAHTVKQTVDGVDWYTTTNEAPQIEKYINHDVDAHLVEYDKGFTYDILAYMPRNADSLEISDVLTDSLEFADAEGNASRELSEVVTSIVAKQTNDHTAGEEGTVATNDGAVDVEGAVVEFANGNPQMLVITIEDASAYRGQWIQVTFHAKYTEDAIANAMNEPVPNDMTIRDNGTVITDIGEHDGTFNEAAYGVAVGNRWTNNYYSNIVTHDAETTQLAVEKKWNVGGKTDWPNAVSVTFGVFKTKDGETTPVMVDADGKIVSPDAEGVYPAGSDQLTVKLSMYDTSGTVTNLPKLEGVTYSAKEIFVNTPYAPLEYADGNTATNGYLFENPETRTIEFIANTTMDTINGVDTYTTINEKPQIEKYINQDVDAHLIEFDKSITYDILAYVPLGADSLEIYDTLDPSLEFDVGNTFAEESSGVDEAVTSIVAKPSNNHKVHGTVAAGGGESLYTPYVGGGAAVPSIGGTDDRTLTVKIDNAEPYRGQWIQVTFKAKYTRDAINAAVVANSQTITGNGTVLGGVEEHDGTTNQAFYKVGVGNTWTSDYYSNIVTHDAETVKVTAEKQWKHADGRPAEWPKDVAEVTVNVLKTTEGADAPEVVGTITLTPDNPRASYESDLPQLTGVTYSVQEVPIKGFTSTVDGEAVINTADTYDVLFSKYELGDDTKELEGATIKVTDSEGIVVAEWTSGDDKDADGTILPHVMQLEAGEYTFEEVNAPDGFLAITTTVTFTVDRDGNVTLKEAYENINGNVSVKDTNHLVLEDLPKLEPTIEKYVNKDVHADIVNFDQEFTYDVMALVTHDATSVEIYDELVKNLQFADKDGKASDDPAAVVLSVVSKDENNSTANGSVAEAGTPVDGYTASIDGNKLTVTIGDATDLRGKWIQVTFNARIKDEFRTLDSLGTQNITDDTPVTSTLDLPSGNKAGDHTGVPNTASYLERDHTGKTLQYFVDDEGKDKPEDSNTVTVIPETTQLTVEKKWNVDGKADWPEGVETVTFGVFNNKGEKVREVTLTKDEPSTTVTGLPKLTGVTYSAKEIAVNGEPVSGADDAAATTGMVKLGGLLEFIANTVKQTVAGVDWYTTTNEAPQIEKYINKDVDAHLVEYDKVVTYDIMAYVPLGADSVEINDPLVDSLGFSDADGNDSADPAAVVSAVVAKASNNHTAGEKGTVSSTDGAPLGDAAVVQFLDAGKRLNVTIADATAYRGKWIQVTFYAKYTDLAIRDVATTPVPDNADVTNNGTVISDIAEHDGTKNVASYKVAVGNEWTSDYDSNTVTHDAETVTVPAEKQWKHADGRAMTTWPVESVAVDVLKVTEGVDTPEVIDTITLTQAQPKGTSKVLPKLAGVTYTIDEVDVPAGYTSTRNGSVIVNTPGTHPVEFSKRELGDDTKELEGAKIKVTGPDGFVEEWTSGKESHVMQLEAGEYTFEEVNAPEGFDAITTTVTFIVDTDGKVTLKEAYENIGGVVNVVDTNHLILEDVPTTHEVIISKQELGESTDELPGAKIKVTGPDGFTEEWTSTTEAHKLKLRAGEYTLEEVNAPEGFEAITTTIRFTVDNKGKVTILNAEEVSGGKVSVADDAMLNHLILEDIRQTVSVTVEKAWLNAQKWPVAVPALWPAGAEVTVNIKDGDTLVKTVVLNADKQSETVTGLPKLVGREYTVEEAEVVGVYALEGDPEITTGEDGNVTVKLTNRLLPTRSELAVEIAKVDPSGEALKGAELEVTGVDVDGNAVALGEAAAWTTDGTNHFLAHIIPGTYTVTEKAAPAGYKIAAPIEFEVTLEGVLMVNGEIADSVVITMTDELEDKPDEEETEEATPTPTPTPTTPVPTPSPSQSSVEAEDETPAPTESASTQPAPSVPSATPKSTMRSLVRTGTPTGTAFVAAFALMGAGIGVLVVRRRKA